MWLFRPLALLAAVFIVLSSSGAAAETSVNIPVGSRLYEDFELLEVRGLIESALLSTKPFGRSEGARLVKEARESAYAPDHAAEISRLSEEFASELTQGKTPGHAGRVYIKFLDSEKQPFFPNINNNGDEFKKGGNLRAGFSYGRGFFDAISLYIAPEYRLDSGSSRGRLLSGYVNIDIGLLEIEAGRDSMWWGSGSHGGLLLTNNARPLDMVKVTSSHPFRLPWVFGYLGLFRPTVFLTHLEKDRDFPRANLLGMRLDFKPTSHFQIGLNRVFLFGGKGRRSLSFNDWLKVFVASDSAEHADSPINGDQIASIDASYVYANRIRYIPFSGVKVYTEWGAEDSSGHTRTPKGKSDLFGVFFADPLWLKGTELRVELANTARSAVTGFAWYRHNVYTSGYRYYGRIIGHHMGSDAKDLFIRAGYTTDGGAKFGVEADQERSDVHFSRTYTRRDWLGADIFYPLSKGVELSGGAGVERNSREKTVNNVLWMELSSNF